MERNVGDTDKNIRIIVGVASFLGALYLCLIDKSLAGGKILTILLGFVGMVLLVTGAINWCPLYAAIGMNTYKKEGKSK